MTKQRGLIQQLISEKYQTVDPSVHDAYLNLSVAKYPNYKVSGRTLLLDCGLEEVASPMTGTCQYYARDFDNKENVDTFENLTPKLKKGIAAVLTIGLSWNFHMTSVPICLRRCNPRRRSKTREMPKYTAEKSQKQYQQHLLELSRSASKLGTMLPTRYWGTAETLKMLAKILQRKIFVLIARSGIDTASYQIFEPRYKGSNCRP
ncbi:hypothetical protein GQ600_2841 [Phytophthora cactorum]|nr:hypothetical protein GQ600_2841 [Phytophthora cactorum]